MSTMFPKPSIYFVPKFYRDGETDNPALTALTDKIDEHITDLEDDLKNLKYLKDPARAPVLALTAFQDWLAANTKNDDDEQQKRQKIASAIDRIKKRSLWLDSIKILIDAIAGGDSQIITIGDSADWIIGQGDNTIIPAAEYWASMGSDGIDDELGIDIIGAGDELELPGNIYIDVDNNALTAAEVAKMVRDVGDEAPAYFRIYLGYLTGTVFTLYDTIN